MNFKTKKTTVLLFSHVIFTFNVFNLMMLQRVYKMVLSICRNVLFLQFYYSGASVPRIFKLIQFFQSNVWYLSIKVPLSCIHRYIFRSNYALFTDIFEFYQAMQCPSQGEIEHLTSTNFNSEEVKKKMFKAALATILRKKNYTFWNLVNSFKMMK